MSILRKCKTRKNRCNSCICVEIVPEPCTKRAAAWDTACLWYSPGPTCTAHYMQQNKHGYVQKRISALAPAVFAIRCLRTQIAHWTAVHQVAVKASQCYNESGRIARAHCDTRLFLPIKGQMAGARYAPGKENAAQVLRAL